jgi:hypothetical protein
VRFLDIAVAVLIGTSALSGLVVWNPRPGDSASNTLAVQSELRGYLLAFLRQHGMTWFLRSPPQEVCSALSADSNATVTMSATLGPFSCSGAPPPGAVAAVLSFSLEGSGVTLTAWSGGTE